MTMLASWNSGQGYMNACTVPWNMRQYVTADACFNLSVPEIDQHPRLKIYPNPAVSNRPITLESTIEISHIKVIDDLGRMVAEFDEHVIELPQSGQYFLGITFSNGERTATKLLITE
jgi:hypothetical protein